LGIVNISFFRKFIWFVLLGLEIIFGRRGLTRFARFVGLAGLVGLAGGVGVCGTSLEDVQGALKIQGSGALSE
jgi:hypothetical protein